MKWTQAKDKLPSDWNTKVFVYGINQVCYLEYTLDCDACIEQCGDIYSGYESNSRYHCPKHGKIPHWTEDSCCSYPSHVVSDNDWWIDIEDMPKPESL